MWSWRKMGIYEPRIGQQPSHLTNEGNFQHSYSLSLSPLLVYSPPPAILCILLCCTLPISEVFLYLNIRSRWSFVMVHQCHTRISINIYWKNKRAEGKGEERKSEKESATINICWFKGRLSGFLSSLDHVHKLRSTWEGGWIITAQPKRPLSPSPQGLALLYLFPRSCVQRLSPKRAL